MPWLEKKASMSVMRENKSFMGILYNSSLHAIIKSKDNLCPRIVNVLY